MRKNVINWKRTPLGSCLEVLCPMILMIIIVFLRFKIQQKDQVDFPLRVLKHPLFPISRPESLMSDDITADEQSTLTMFSEIYSQDDISEFV